jgi:hypothetical protein
MQWVLWACAGSSLALSLSRQAGEAQQQEACQIWVQTLGTMTRVLGEVPRPLLVLVHAGPAVLVRMPTLVEGAWLCALARVCVAIYAIHLLSHHTHTHPNTHAHTHTHAHTCTHTHARTHIGPLARTQ